VLGLAMGDVHLSYTLFHHYTMEKILGLIFAQWANFQSFFHQKDSPISNFYKR